MSIDNPKYLKDMFIDEVSGALNGGSGGTSSPVSWNDLTDKPFYDGGRHDVVWDGSIDGRIQVQLDEATPAVKLSDYIPKPYEVLGQTIKIIENGEEYEYIVSDDDIMQISDNGSFVVDVFFVITENNAEVMGIVFPEAGVYSVRIIPEEGALIYGSFLGIHEVKKIDKMFLPSVLPEITEDVEGLTLGVINGEYGFVDALPSVTTSDAGKFLRVNNQGKWTVSSIPNAEGVSF